MLKYIIFLSLTIALVAVAVVSGCSGGGSAAKPTLRGVANIHSDTTAPRIGFYYLVSGAFVAYSSTSMPRSSSGWQDVNWAIPLPTPGAKSLYAIIVTNDINGDGQYSTNEFLGSPKDGSLYLFLKDNRDGKTFSIVNMYDDVYFSDASKCKGKNIFVNCTFTRAASNLSIFEQFEKISE